MAAKKKKTPYRRYTGKVRALKTCITSNCYREAGSVFEFDGLINPSVLLPLEDEAPVSKPVARPPSRQSKTTESTTPE